ncbi:hypothetical protein AVEN_255207-1 [Araneus ventricosus]|uniref:Uncharacterized protein n=1 Tax=Araneus ventricosus TaxID=182803 RepID=A0A4Y2BBA6_ARAVE|nr:hypothetical protein AVEN_255207-1 [Araneus ventricosus]
MGVQRPRKQLLEAEEVVMTSCSLRKAVGKYGTNFMTVQRCCSKIKTAIDMGWSKYKSAASDWLSAFLKRKADIHCRTVPHHLERVSPDRSSFQPIHLGGTFMEARCKRHNWSLQSPRATVHTPPSRFLDRASFALQHFVVDVNRTKSICLPYIFS